MLMTLLLLIPLLGAASIIFAPARLAKTIALVASMVAFVLSVIMAFMFGEKWGTADFGLNANIGWFETLGVTLNMGADSVSMLLVLLTTLLMPLCVWGSATAIRERLKEYYGWLLVIETAMVGVFVATDLIFFYICFELTLIPMFFLIAIYGGENRAKACVKFFIYTFTGSMLTLAGLVYVAWRFSAESGAWSFSIPELVSFSSTMTAKEQAWILFALLAGFAVKVPLFPLHTWLPLAHTEAPTAGSVILAAVLLKLGTYGLYRFVLPMVPDGLLEQVSIPLVWWSWDFVPLHFIGVISVIGILYAALICWVQTDIKRLVAYSSVSHLGFCVLGLFALNPLGAQGSVLYMLNHGLSTGALFFLVGMIYERYHTRDMDAMSGLAKVMPVWATFMVFFVLSSVGLPGLNGFVSEFLCLIGAFIASPDNATYPGMFGPWYAAVAGIGMIFAAMYLLIMVGKVVFGPLKEPPVHNDGHSLPRDLTFREIGVLLPLAVLCIYIGFRPHPVTTAMEGSIESALAAYPSKVRQIAQEREGEAELTMTMSDGRESAPAPNREEDADG